MHNIKAQEKSNPNSEILITPSEVVEAEVHIYLGK
jgi:hypothetical protein